MAPSSIVPSAPPPPGQSCNFVDPEYNGARFVAVNAIFLPLARVAVAVRMYGRAGILRVVGLDDYFMILALAFSVILSGTTLACAYGTVIESILAAHKERLVPSYGLGRHLWDVPLDWLSPHFLKLNLVAAIVFCLGTGAAKFSILLLYLRLFPGNSFRTVVFAIIFVAAGYNVASALVNIFSCDPIAESWDVTIVDGHCIDRPVFYLANAGLGIATDFVTVLAPLPMLWKLRLPTKQKIGVALVITTGGLSVPLQPDDQPTTPPTRPQRLHRLPNPHRLPQHPPQSRDLTWNTTNALTWCVIELNASILGGSVPSMKPVVRKHFPRLLGLASSADLGYMSEDKNHALQLRARGSKASAGDFVGTSDDRSEDSTVARCGERHEFTVEQALRFRDGDV